MHATLICLLEEIKLSYQEIVLWENKIPTYDPKNLPEEMSIKNIINNLYFWKKFIPSLKTEFEIYCIGKKMLNKEQYSINQVETLKTDTLYYSM